MARLTKTMVIAAHNELHKLIGFRPALDTNVKQTELEPALQKAILDIELDDDDREKISEETLSVIDRLAKKYPDITASEPEEEEEEEKPKKAKKSKKGKKAKKEKEVEIVEDAKVVEDEKSKKAKKSKGKKAKGNDALIEQINESSFKELQAIVKENEVFTGFPSIGYKTDVFKARLVEVLEGALTVEEAKAEVKAIKEAGKKAAADKPKKEKKVKKSEPTLTEQVEAAEDDDLKGLLKANKESFPGVKAKDYKKAKKLRKAMLKAVVEEKPKKKTGVPKTGKSGVRQVDFMRDLIRKGTKKSKIVKALADEYDQSEKWAENRIKIYEKAYGEGGENDPKLNPKAKKSKKAAPKEEPKEEPKKEKKSKKDKKGKKKGKKSKK